MSKQTVCCNGCGSEFLKESKEVNRRRRAHHGCKFYCSKHCYEIHGDWSKNLGEHLGLPKSENLRVGSEKDEFSPFRYFARKSRARDKSSDLDLPFLKELWESQGGVCPLTGVTMFLHSSSLEWERDRDNPWKPSLDRVDPGVGYKKGNVRFITMIANFCKYTWGDSVVIEFCHRVNGKNPGF